MALLEQTDLQQAWIDFKEAGDIGVRNQLVIHYSNLVRFSANRVASGLPAMVDRDDLISYGTFGLLDAIDKFDLGKGVKFETYAATRIRGAILDEIRSLDWVPRSVRSKAREIERTKSEVEAITGRPAEHSEIAAALELTMAEYWELASQANAPSSVHMSLDTGQFNSYGNDASYDHSSIDALDPTSNPMDLLESEEVLYLVGEAVSNMDERSKTILVLYYLHEMTLKEIGQIFGVTESRVCQLQSKAFLALKDTLGHGGLAA